MTPTSARSRATSVPSRSGSPAHRRSLCRLVTGIFKNTAGILAIAAVFAVSLFAQGVAYNAIPDTLAPNYLSLAFESTQTKEFGDFVTLAGSNRQLNTVTFTMSNWSLKSTPANVAWCGANPGKCNAEGFFHDFTVTIYNIGAGSPGTRNVGSSIATVTQTKLVPWRPEADPTCATTTAWRAGDGNCYNGYAFNLTFDMSGTGAILPNNVVVGIAYNTRSHGYAPLGVSGPYDSLNVGAEGLLTVGTDNNADNVFWNTSTASWYADGGVAGSNIFREDSNWTPNGTLPIRITTTSNRVVRPSASLDWSASSANGGSIGYVADATAPSGDGALNMITANSNSSRTNYGRSVNVPLSQIYQLGYSSKTNSGSAYAAPAYVIGVYLDGTPLTFTSFTFEPYMSDGLGDPTPVVPGTWQTWDVYNNPNLWASRTVNAGGACQTTAGAGGPPFYSLAALKAACPNALVISHSVNMGTFNPDWNTNVDLVNFNGTTYDFEPDPAIIAVDDDGKGTAADCEAEDPTHSTIQGGINAAVPGQTVKVCPGNYVEDVNVNKADLILQGSGVDVSTITGPYNAGGSDTLRITASGVTVDGFTITRNGNSAATWGVNIKNQGVNVAASSNFTLQNSKVTGNRNGVYVGQSSYNVILRRNVIDNNRTGVHLVDNNGGLIEQNQITNNWTIGLLYRCEGCGINPSPLTVRNNNISDNWYGDIEFREPAIGGLLNMSGNYLGTAVTTTTAPPGEPGYAVQIPEAFGGTSTAPASHPTIAGAQSARVDFSPYLNSGADTDPATPGFQGDFTHVTANAASPQAFGSANNAQEAIGAAIAGGSVTLTAGTYAGNVVVNKAVNLIGSGTVTGSLTTTAAGASISPGSSPGILNTGNLTLISGTTVNMEINGLTPGTLHDQINVTGTVDLGGATLNVITSFSPAPANQFVIVNNDGSDPVTGTFNGLANGATFVAGGTTYVITYNGGDGNDVVLTAGSSTCISVIAQGGLSTLRNTSIDVPLNVGDTTGRGIISYDFKVRFNPTVLSFDSTQNTGTLSSGMINTSNVVNISPTVSEVTISGYTTTALAGAGNLLSLRFTAIGDIGTSSDVDITTFMFNNGPPCVNFTDGSVSIISSTVSGNVTYGTSATSKPVPNVTMTGTGSVAVADSTDDCGDYNMSGFGPGAYTVTPSKSGDVNGITAFDASKIAQHVVGISALNANQLLAADVSNDAFVNSFDAALIAQSLVLIPNPSSTGTWKFVPANRTYTNVETAAANEDYVGILMGEVSGDWVAPGSCGSPFAEMSFAAGEPVPVSAAEVEVPAGQRVVVPIRIGDLTEKGIVAYQFDVRFDPNVLSPEQAAADSIGTVSNGLQLIYNAPKPGLLKVAVFGVRPMDGEGTLLNLNFSAVGKGGSSSAIEIEGFILNEGRQPVNVTNGRVSVAANNGGVLSGTVLSATGRGIANAAVTITSSAGESRTITANPHGQFSFGELGFGETYTMTAKARKLVFRPVTVVMADNATSVDITAEP